MIRKNQMKLSRAMAIVPTKQLRSRKLPLAICLYVFSHVSLPQRDLATFRLLKTFPVVSPCACVPSLGMESMRISD